MVATACRAGARVAEPGEFTLRAFLAGRLDLTQAEAVLGVIDARGDSDFSAALAQLAGGISRPLKELRDDLLQLLAELEAGLDFVEEDIAFISTAEILRRLDSAADLVGEVAAQMASRHTATSLPQITLAGRPNAGKSSLFNAITARWGVKRELQKTETARAIVSPQRGTTRDYITAKISLDGIVCEIVDTAGVDNISASPREIDGPLGGIERAAQSLADERRRHAAIRACCMDVSDPAAADIADCDLLVFTKSDLRSGQPFEPGNLPAVSTSVLRGTGLDHLRDHLKRLLMCASGSQDFAVVAATAERCRESIRLAETALKRAARAARSEDGDELVAAEVRDALAELGKVVGAIYTDDLLDRIFNTFCIGK
jgi:tRNA modification GTPase